MKRFTSIIPFALLALILIIQLSFNAQTKNDIPWLSSRYFHLNNLPVYQQKTEAEKLITVVKNQHNNLPFSSLDSKFVLLTVGEDHSEFTKTIQLFSAITEIHISFSGKLTEAQKKTIEHADQFIFSIHVNENHSLTEQALDEFHKLRCSGKKTVVFFTPFEFAKNVKLPHNDALVLAYENHPYIQNRTAQMLFGAIPATGKLPDDFSAFHPKNSGIELKWGGRLKFTDPEEVGIDPAKLAEIDRIALNGIKQGAYPGCEIVAAVDGKIFYRKSFGTHSYTDTTKVKIDDIYDLASITKIGASTTGLMFLQSHGKFDVSKKLADYIPEYVEGTNMERLLLKDMLTHQAGLKAWIPS